MEAVKMQERCLKNRKRENGEKPHDRRGKLNKKTLGPLYIFPALTGSRLPAIDEASKYKVTLKTRELRKESHLRDKNYLLAKTLRSGNSENLRYTFQQDTKGLNCNKKRSLKGLKRPLVLPLLPTRVFAGRVSKQEISTAAKTMSKSGQKMFPKYLPKIETRKHELKDLNLATTKAEETKNQRILPPLAKRTAKPLRAAISSSATRRGLITLDLEEQFILRFRLSNYDVKDINVANLNAPV